LDNFDSYNTPVAPPGSSDDTSVMTMKDWLITFLISAIPCVGFIMLFVWAFGTGNLNRKNYSRAMLIWLAIVTVLSMIFSALFGAALAAYFSNFAYY
jgi:hypothetical protein